MACLGATPIQDSPNEVKRRHAIIDLRNINDAHRKAAVDKEMRALHSRALKINNIARSNQRWQQPTTQPMSDCNSIPKNTDSKENYPQSGFSNREVNGQTAPKSGSSKIPIAIRPNYVHRMKPRDIFCIRSRDQLTTLNDEDFIYGQQRKMLKQQRLELENRALNGASSSANPQAYRNVTKFRGDRPGTVPDAPLVAAINEAKLARQELLAMGYVEKDKLTRSFKKALALKQRDWARDGKKLVLAARKYYPKDRLEGAGGGEQKVPPKGSYLLSDTYKEFVNWFDPALPPIHRAEYKPMEDEAFGTSQPR